MRSTSAIVPLAFVLFAGAAPGSEPTLDHDAPFLGHVLHVRLEGAPPFATVRLLESPSRGERVLAYGTLELESTQLALAALGSADASGAFVVALALPADAASAEAERHWQAVVEDPAAPAGAVLSEAVHVRLLGPRVYVPYAGRNDDVVSDAGLDVVGAVDRAVSVSVDFGPSVALGQALGDGLPVFTPSFDRGAVMASASELVLFDPFFGDVLRRVPFEEASRSLLVDPSGERLYVLETGLTNGDPRVVALDFHTGDVLRTRRRRRVSPGLWSADAAGTAYVAELHEVTGQPHVARFDLGAFAERGTFAVGSDHSKSFTSLLLDEGQLFVGTDGTEDTGGNTSYWAELTRADLTSFPPATELRSFSGSHALANLTPVPLLNRLLFSTSTATSPGGAFRATRLASSGPFVVVGPPGYSLGIGGVAMRDTDAWTLVTSPDHDEPERLWRLDVPASTWTNFGGLPCYSGGVGVGVVRDAWVDQVVLAVRECGVSTLQDATLVFHDPVTAAQTEVSVGDQPTGLRVVAVP